MLKNKVVYFFHEIIMKEFFYQPQGQVEHGEGGIAGDLLRYVQERRQLLLQQVRRQRRESLQEHQPLASRMARIPEKVQKSFIFSRISFGLKVLTYLLHLC